MSPVSPVSSPPYAKPAVIARHAGFTLIELLAVVAIIVVLIALLFPGMKWVRDTSSAAKCLSNLRQLGLASRLYAADNQGDLPPANFVATLLPYVENLSAPFWCPSDARVPAWKSSNSTASSGRTSYAYNAVIIGLATTKNRWNTECWVRARTLPVEIGSPASKILFLDAGNYYCQNVSNKNAAFRHNNSLNAAYLDGHVGRVSGGSAELYQDRYWVAKP